MKKVATQMPAKKTVAKKPAAKPFVYDKRPPMPKIGDPAVYYKCGKVYTCAKNNIFRVIVQAANYSSERRASWGQSAPTPEAWAEALRLTDAGKACP